MGHRWTALAAVADLGAARPFYTDLFGRPPDSEPMPTLAQWDLDSGGHHPSDPVAGQVSRLTQVVDPAGNVVTVAELPR